MKAYGKSWGYNVYDCRYCLYRKGKLNIKEELRNKTVIIIEHNFSDTQYFQKVFVITGYGKVERTK